MKQLIDKLEAQRHLTQQEWIELITLAKDRDYLMERAVAVRKSMYSNSVFVRGLIEFTNYCKNDCLYCGIRRSSGSAQRYRLSEEEIMDCCRQGYELGFRTFVLQGGEDPYFNDAVMVKLIHSIKSLYPDCAITLSFGERSKESYQNMYEAGADRYLLRHETADESHYSSLHPAELTLENRMRCLWDLKEIGFQVGCGFMVGSPGQTPEHLAKDMLFIEELQPQMVGIGPFLPHHDTPFADRTKGSLDTTLYMLSLLRLLKPDLLIPATTALGTIDPLGREKGILAGANVVMPNLSPTMVRKKYELYDNKICTGDEAAECKVCLHNRMKKIGYEIVVDRGDPCTMKSAGINENTQDKGELKENREVKENSYV